jgi:hypothetical protein
MVSFQITCVKKTRRTEPHQRITHIGGGSREKFWRFTQRDAIDGIESGTWSFHVRLNGALLKVDVATGELGHKYLKTQADGLQPENLLALPQCT